MFLSTFSSAFPTITKTLQIESADFNAGSVLQWLTAGDHRTNKLNKGDFICKCYFLMASESWVFHKTELEERKIRLCGSCSVSHIPGPQEIHTPSNNRCPPPLPLPAPRVHQRHSVPPWRKYSWTRSSTAPTHATSQKLALPRSPVTVSLPKPNGRSPSWCSLTYVQNLTLLITNYTTLPSWLLSLFPHLVYVSLHLI